MTEYTRVYPDDFYPTEEYLTEKNSEFEKYKIADDFSISGTKIILKNPRGEFKEFNFSFDGIKAHVEKWNEFSGYVKEP